MKHTSHSYNHYDLGLKEKRLLFDAEGAQKNEVPQVQAVEKATDKVVIAPQAPEQMDALVKNAVDTTVGKTAQHIETKLTEVDKNITNVKQSLEAAGAKPQDIEASTKGLKDLQTKLKNPNITKTDNIGQNDLQKKMQEIPGDPSRLRDIAVHPLKSGEQSPLNKLVNKRPPIDTSLKSKENKAVSNKVSGSVATDTKVNTVAKAEPEDQESPEEEKEPTTNKERIDQGIAKAKAVLNDKNAKPLDKISAVISMVMLSFENISRQIDGTLNLKPADKNGEVPENVADDKTVTENKPVQRKRLQQELKKSEKPVDAFINDKQDSLNKKVDGTTTEAGPLDIQIAGFDTEIEQTQTTKKDKLKEIENLNRKLNVLEKKESGSSEIQPLKKQIADAQQQVANLDQDIQATVNKKQIATQRRDSLLGGMENGEIANLRSDIKELKLMKADANKAMEEYKTDMEVIAKELGKTFPSFKDWMKEISVAVNEKTISPEITIKPKAVKAIEDFALQNDLKIQLASKVDDNNVIDIKDLKLVLDQFLKKAS